MSDSSNPISTSRRAEATGLVEELAEEPMPYRQGEAKPTVGLIPMLDMRRTRREPRGQRYSDGQGTAGKAWRAQLEIVAAAHEMQCPAALEHIQRHAQLCRELLHQRAVRADHFRGTHQAPRTVRPSVLPIPGDALLRRPHSDDRRNMTAGARHDRRADQLTEPGQQPPQQTRPDYLELTDIVDGKDRLAEARPHRARQPFPGGRAEYSLQPMTWPMTRRIHRVAGTHDLCTAHDGTLPCLVADHLRDLLTETHHLQQRPARHSFDGVVPARQRLDEFELSENSLAHQRRSLLVGLQLIRAALEESECRVDLAVLAPFDDGADHLPRIVLSGKEIAPVTQRVGHTHQTPRQQLLQTDTHIGACDTERFRDLIGVQSLRGQIQQRVDLGDRAIQSPAAAHLAPVDDVAMHDGGEFHVFSDISVFSEIIVNIDSLSRP